VTLEPGRHVLRLAVTVGSQNVDQILLRP